MRTLSAKRSIGHYWEELVYLEAALLASEETAALAEPVTAALAEFNAISQRDLDTRRGIIQANARTSVADANLDNVLREIHANTLHLVKQDRGRKEYTTLFPGALTALIRHALAKQVVVARETIGKLGLSVFDPAFRAVQVALLEPVIAKGEGVLAERKQAEHDRLEGRIEIETWKQEVNAVRVSVYAQLLTLATKLKHKRAWAEAFFPAAPARSASEDEVEVVVDEEVVEVVVDEEVVDGGDE